MYAESVCIGCGRGRISSVDGVNVCAACGLRAAASAEHLDYAAAYAGDQSLYAEHIKMLDHFQTVDAVLPLLLPFERRILERLGDRTEMHSLVDLGCGTGRFLRAVEAAGLQAIGYEVATVLVERLRRHGRAVKQGGIDEFLAAKESADAVSLLEVVEHLVEPGQVIQRLYAEVRPRMLIVVVPQWRIRRRFDTRFAEHDVPPNHLTWWDETALRYLLAREGYRVSVESVPERRKSLLGHIVRNHRRPAAVSLGEWIGAIVNPPPFWLLGVAERT